MSTALPHPGLPAGKHRPPLIDEAWLAKHREAILEPHLQIVDPHHHLFDGGNLHYLLPEVLADMASGHNVVASVFSDCRAHYRTDGPEHLKPVGETEFVVQTTATQHSRRPAVCAGICGVADLFLGARIEEVLLAHLEAGKGRFRGIRGHTHSDPEVAVAGVNWPPGMLVDARVLEALAVVARLGLVYDAWLFHPQIRDLAEVARRNPELPIVLNHCGGPLGVGRWKGREADVLPIWRRDMELLSRCPNVYVKLGGLGTTTVGFELWDREEPIGSEELAREWRRWIEPSLQLFGPARCMFESNFPVDKRTCSHAVLWNAFKLLARGCSPSEKADLFAGTASRVYRLNLA